MQEIQLRANAINYLFSLYTACTCGALGIVLFLYKHQDITGIMYLYTCLGIFIYFIALIYSAHPKFNQHHVASVSIKQHGQWVLVLSNQLVHESELVSSSILTSHFALLKFKVGKMKKYSMVVMHTKKNKDMYHKLAKWWHSEQKK